MSVCVCVRVRESRDTFPSVFECASEFLDLKHKSSIFRSVIQPCMWFLRDGMMVRLCTVWPMENWLGTSKTTYRVGGMI